MKNKLSIFFSILCFALMAQPKFQWIEKATYKIDSVDNWTADLLGNVYISKRELIQKYDSIGKFKFSQSQKSVGRVSSIQAINTMKMIVFSEEQQEICFLDNTLTPYESCVNFVDQNIGNATKVAVSSQPDKFWVYDQLNSRLHLLSLVQTSQAQEIENLKGLLNSIQIAFMFEHNSNLYIVDFSQGVYCLDMYGSLLNFIKKTDFKGFQVDSDLYYFIEANTLLMFDNEMNTKFKVGCPINEIIDFKKIGNNYYFRTAKEIKKYHLLLEK